MNDGICRTCGLPITALLLIVGDGPVCRCTRPPAKGPGLTRRKRKKEQRAADAARKRLADAREGAEKALLKK